MFHPRLVILALLLSAIVIGATVFASGPLYMSWSSLSAIFSSHPKPPTSQGVMGTATMGFWAITCSPVTNRIGPDLNVTNSHGQTVQYSLTWNTVKNPLYSCDYLTTFRIELQPGTYSITINSITAAQCYKPQTGFHGGFSCNLPYQIDVKPGQYSTVSLSVGGGL